MEVIILLSLAKTQDPMKVNGGVFSALSNNFDRVFCKSS